MQPHPQIFFPERTNYIMCLGVWIRWNGIVEWTTGIVEWNGMRMRTTARCARGNLSFSKTPS